ncbi:MAG: hypothetical protein C0608_06710 [Deltaproteobacteria bacterium]|nr:MAG: hypothetical protein C0608_06710 [Deltaproteobacteria bacterium]
MSLRRAVITITTIALALSTFGCGMTEDYEGGAALSVDANDAVATATAEYNSESGTYSLSLEDPGLTFTLINDNLLGAGEEGLDIWIRSEHHVLYDFGGNEIYNYTKEVDHYIEAGSSKSVYEPLVIPLGEISSILFPFDVDEEFAKSAYTLYVDFIGKEVAADGALGDTHTVRGSATIHLERHYTTN